jgi:hypothetical protein
LAFFLLLQNDITNTTVCLGIKLPPPCQTPLNTAGFVSIDINDFNCCIERLEIWQGIEEAFYFRRVKFFAENASRIFQKGHAVHHVLFLFLNLAHPFGNVILSA